MTTFELIFSWFIFLAIIAYISFLVYLTIQGNVHKSKKSMKPPKTKFVHGDISGVTTNIHGEDITIHIPYKSVTLTTASDNTLTKLLEWCMQEELYEHCSLIQKEIRDRAKRRENSTLLWKYKV